MENENIEGVLELAQDSNIGIFKTEENFHNADLHNEDGFSLEMITPQFLDLVERIIELSCPKGFLCKECNENTNDCMNEKIMEDMMDFIKSTKEYHIRLYQVRYIAWKIQNLMCYLPELIR